MFDRFRNLFNKTEVIPTKPKVLITIHGFGVRRELEMEQLVAYARDRFPEIITFNMFDIDDSNDDDYMKWIQRAEIVIQKELNDNKEIYLLGFSMGGVIASYLASKYAVRKLVLVAPAFIHFNLENYTTMLIKGANQLLSSKKEYDLKPKMPLSFYNGFLDCVKQYKHTIEKVSCPVLILHGDSDEVISKRSSEWAYEHISHSMKRCIILHLGKHRLLQDQNCKDVAFFLIESFLSDKLLPIKTIDD